MTFSLGGERGADDIPALAYAAAALYRERHFRTDGTPADETLVAAAGRRGTRPWKRPDPPFNAADLAMMDRVSDPRLWPDGSEAAFAMAKTDCRMAVWSDRPMY